MLSAVVICLIVSISDGDTLTARCPTQDAAHPYQQVKIRLAGIDAPEQKQPFGQRSKTALSDLCFQVEAKVTTKNTDRYGRTVADVECQGKDAGQEQVSAGMAWVYDKYANGYALLYPLQKSAQASKRGLWADPAPTPPWEWRKAKKSKATRLIGRDLLADAPSCAQS